MSSSKKRLGDSDEQPDSKYSRINELDASIAITSSRFDELVKTVADVQLITGK